MWGGGYKRASHGFHHIVCHFCVELSVIVVGYFIQKTLIKLIQEENTKSFQNNNIISEILQTKPVHSTNKQIWGKK